MKINKFLVAGLLALTGVATGVAQQVQWGIKAGYNLSSLSGAPEGSDVQFRSGFHVGGLAEFRLTDKLRLQPELLYSTEGAKSTFTFDGGELVINSNEEVRLSYLNLPVMLTYEVTGGLSLQAGPQLGYLLSAESDYDFSTNFLGEPFSESGTDDLMDEGEQICAGT